jgi:hypothetical protein
MYQATNSTLNLLTRSMVEKFSNLADQDSDDSECEGLAAVLTPQGRSVGGETLDLKDIIDLESDFWINYSPSKAIGSLELELKAYEILDLDADGEDAFMADFDIDPMVEECASY